MKNIYHADHLVRKHYKIPLDEEKEVLKKLASRNDAEAQRLKQYLALPDLTRLTGSPVQAITERVVTVESLKGFDFIETPEIVSPQLVFDLFNFPKNHPARSSSDTYYIDKVHALRPHTSLMWKYYLDLPDVQEKLAKQGSAGVICYGKVYRRDEIDWQHSNVLHHIDGLFICRKDIQEIKQKDLEDILTEVAVSLFGKNMQSNFAVDHFPYTDPSIEMNIAWDNKWVEILGAGVPHPTVLQNLGLDPEVYTGWAFGFGADRLAMIKMRIPDIRLLRSEDERVTSQFKDLDAVYKPVSKYPPVLRDISFVVADATFNIFRYYEIVREVVGEHFVEEVKLLDTFADEKRFGAGNTSYTFRITYRNLDRTLTNSEVDVLHKKLEEQTKKEFSATIR